ncbi:hypothetical protein GCM10007242_41180 [Pigmentiphaga litoralis]|uniref:hypothetical protein n=1 Tax=Pigmentiphaga litoralis TaxID=516702 RepID=UPI0016754DFB|nr:hypothetical protein [Pigmentiphaga litoralis]GGX30339.1 hypothetical protein GCM10007242_41180 [Pigmentiphaga litoralis]
MTTTNTLPLDGERLLQIARDTGLRHHLHGVAPAGARALLSQFIAAVHAAQRAAAQAPADGLVTLSACPDEYLDGVRAPFVVQRQDDPIAYVLDLSDGQRIVAAFNDSSADEPKAHQLDAIDGAIAFGVSGVNAPPAGHWLQRFWDIGRDQAAVRGQALEEAALAILAGDEKSLRENDYMWDADDCAAEIRALKGTPAAALAGCGCSDFEQKHCRGAASPFAEHPDCARAAAVEDAHPVALERAVRDQSLLEVIQALNGNPYSLTKSECINVVETLKGTSAAACIGCGGPGWYTSHTTGYGHWVPCRHCNPGGKPVSQPSTNPGALAAANAHDCCANCLWPESEHRGDKCPPPYTTVWHAWDYDSPPDAAIASKALDAQPSGNAGELEKALRLAEAALADIGDADREPGDDVAWCERRAAQALPAVRAAIAASKEGASHE